MDDNKMTDDRTAGDVIRPFSMTSRASLNTYIMQMGPRKLTPPFFCFFKVNTSFYAFFLKLWHNFICLLSWTTVWFENIRGELSGFLSSQWHIKSSAAPVVLLFHSLFVSYSFSRVGLYYKSRIAGDFLRLLCTYAGRGWTRDAVLGAEMKKNQC